MRAHVVVNPTWRCQLRCAYCWMPHTAIRREAVEHTWQEWAIALARALPQHTIVDFSGGEPLLFPGLPDLLKGLAARQIAWAITTNALEREAVTRLCRVRPQYGVVINVSDHAGNARARDNIALLRAAGFRVSVNRVSHPGAGHHEGEATELPFQDWAAGEALDGKRRECDAGLNHWAADTAGDVWRCQVSMQLGHEPVANLFTGEQWPVSTTCGFGCSTCYRDTPESWCIRMREVVE